MSLYFFPEARTTDAPNEIFSPSEYFRTARLRSPLRDLQEFGTQIERRDVPLLSYARRQTDRGLAPSRWPDPASPFIPHPGRAYSSSASVTAGPWPPT